MSHVAASSADGPIPRSPIEPTVLVDMCRLGTGDLMYDDDELIIDPSYGYLEPARQPRPAPLAVTTAGGDSRHAIERQLRAEINTLQRRVHNAETNAATYVENREIGFRRVASEHEEIARDICRSELAESEARMISDFNNVHRGTIGQAETAINDVRQQGMNYAEEKMAEAKRMVIAEAEKRFQQKQEETHREFQKLENHLRATNQKRPIRKQT